jgi:uncharacterized membrane protein
MAPMENYLEYTALAWFLFCSAGYTWYAKHHAHKRACLSNTLNLYREDWMRVMLQRGNRMSDTSVVGNLERNGAFFASSCLLILAGIITALGYTSEAMEIFASMPLSPVPTRQIWELRLLVLMVVFIYAFFKFTWSMRMYNFLAVMIGSAPLAEDTKTTPAGREAFAKSAGKICDLAGDAFNLGLRSYYYALSVVAWFFHPIAFMVASTLIVYVLYRREFHSDALNHLRSGKIFEQPVVAGKTKDKKEG